MSVKYLSAALFFVACLALSNCYGDTNIAANPSFEDDSAWGGRGATFATTTEQKLSGNKSGKASDRTANWQGLKQSLLSKMKAGETYQISAWVRLENSISAQIIVSIEQKDDERTKYINIATTTANDSNWVQLSGSFTLSPVGSLGALDVYFEGPAPGINFYVDDVNIVGPSAAAPPAAEPNKPADPNVIANEKANMSINFQKTENSGTTNN